MVLPVSSSLLIESTPVQRDKKVRLVPFGWVRILIEEPENTRYKILNDTWGYYLNIRLIKGKAAEIVTFFPSLNKPYFVFNYQNNESVSLYASFLWGSIGTIEAERNWTRVWGYAILPILIISK